MHLKNLIIVIAFGCIFVSTCLANDYMNPEWVDPHAWSNDKDPLSTLCPKSEPCKQCEKDAKPEYLRLVNTLFDPNQFRFDESTNYYYRTVHIHVTKQQLESLRKSKDITHMDGLISDILSQTQFGTVQLVKEFTIDMMSMIWERLPTFDFLPRSKPILINFGLLLLSYFVCRRFNISFSVAIFFTVIYFLYEYLDYECHKRIELDEAVDFIYGKQHNPCKGPAKGDWFDWIIGRDSKTLCREYLAKQSHGRNQCGIVDLFHEFTTNIVLKQLKLFIISVSELIRSISTTNGILITAVVEDASAVFKFILNPTIWSRVVADMSPRVSEQNSTSTQRRLALESDLRDENLSKALDLANIQMKLLLKTNNVQSRTDAEPSSVEILPIVEKAEENILIPTEIEQSKTNESLEANNLRESNLNDHTTSGDGDSSNESVDEDISILVINRSQSKSQELPPKNGSSSETSDKSLDSEYDKCSGDIEFITDLPPDTATSTTRRNSNL